MKETRFGGFLIALFSG